MEESKSKKPSSVKVILMGELLVNLPVTALIFLSAFIMNKLGMQFRHGLLIGSAIGWFFWDKLLNLWISWAFKNGIEAAALYKLGKIGLVNFSRHRIYDFKSKDSVKTNFPWVK